MGWIRTIKPEFFLHETLFEVEKKSSIPLRLAFAGLICQCDREGRFRWRPNILKLDILPWDSVDFGDVLECLRDAGMIERYEVEGESYGWIPSFKNHQIINNRERGSILPNPNDYASPRVGHASSTRHNEVVHAASGEWKGIERKGTEKNRSGMELTTRGARVDKTEETHVSDLGIQEQNQKLIELREKLGISKAWNEARGE